MDLSLYLQSNYFFFPSKDTTSNNGGHLSIYDHFGDDQTKLASKLGAQQHSLAKPNLLQINPKP